MESSSSSHLLSQKAVRKDKEEAKTRKIVLLPMRMTRFSGFFAQSILRWTSFMRSSVEIDSSASADIFFSYFFVLCLWRFREEIFMFMLLSDESKTKSNKI